MLTSPRPAPCRAATLIALGVGLALAIAGTPPAHAKTAPAPRATAHEAAGAFGNFLTGQLAMVQVDIPTAADRYLAALADDPTQPELRTRALIAAAVAGRPEAQKLAHLLPTNPASIMLLGNLDARDGHWPAAIERMRSIPDKASGTMLRPLLTAWAQQGAGRTDDALATLRDAIARNARLKGLFQLHMALINDLAGRNGEAARLYALAQGNELTIGLRVGQMLASWEARQQRGSIEARPGDAVERRLAERMSPADPTLLALPALERAATQRAVRSARDGLAETYLAVGAAQHQAKADDAALLLLRLALDMRPDFTPARLLQADIVAARHQPQAALDALAQIPADDPLAPVVRLRRAVLTNTLGHLDDAVTQLRAMAADFPDRPEPLEQLADLLRADGQFAKAAETYGAALARLKPFDPTAWGLYFQRGICFERAGDWAKAEPDLQHALELAPNNPSVLNYLAYSWADKGQHLTRARQMLEHAAIMQPDNGAIIDSLGWVKLRQGDVNGAIDLLEHAVEMESEDPTINLHLGDAYARAGRKLEALYQWRRAITLKPEPAELAHAQAEVAEAEAAFADAAAQANQATPAPTAN